ncbi:LacI family transcriptional regulator [Sphingopyxis panaciterrae]|uniref:substrate-binding domain-containing protein n=1 Tax=Sphingopyxis panaciterrae TaxID=363841 RepID=UPI0014243E4B|nr:LacI family transcriptional regulator [Sphingopyxis panaciterrae]
MRKPATLDDVAAIAGVSAKTVSRVVNRNANVSAATRERIEAAIRETGYHVNQAARSLAASRSFLIGAFMPHLSSFYFAEIFRGAAKACRQYGYHLVVEEFDHGVDTMVDRYEQGLRSARCDALILTPPVCDDERLLAALDRDGMPYVRIAPGIRPGVSAALSADDAQGVQQLARHLWASGRRRFAIIAGPADHAAAMIRENSFVETLAGLGGDPEGILLTRIELHESISESGRAATLDLLRRVDPLPDAIFAFNDEVAIGAMAAARELGLTVPGDVAIAGFDDSYIAQLAWPPLTTIHQPIADLAFQAVGVVASGESFAASQILLPTSLVVRGTA